MTDTKVSTLDLPASDGDPNQVADLYADRLMDDLFDGVERALAGDAQALIDLRTPLAEPPSPDLATTTDGSLAPAIDVTPTLASDPISTSAAYALATGFAPEPDTQVSTPAKRRWYLIPLTLGAVGISVATALILAWFSQRSSTVPEAAIPAPAVDAVATSPDAEFLEYLRRSLDVISQQTAAATTGAPGDIPEVSVALNGPGIGLPPISGNALPAGAAMGPNGLPQINVIERVYIPYQAGQPVAAVPAPAATGAPGVAPVAPTPVSNHALVGILELGDRSAALFEINGVPQRVYIGERIGNSGWSLVSVANGEAVVRRNGEVRSILIGQQF
jgi:hypothetical protein